MTRINVGVDPKTLHWKHLMAEHREIKRIPNVVCSGKYSLTGQPVEFKLGTGHVKFFYNKLLYLKNRYITLHQECLRRGYDVQNYEGAWANVPKNLMNDWIPTDEARLIVMERINERLIAMQKKSTE